MRLYRSKNWLYQKYIIGKLSSLEIGKICNTSHATICRWLKQFNIKTRSPGETFLKERYLLANKTYRNKAWLEDKYINEHLSLEKIAKLCKSTARVICNWMERFGIKRRTYKENNSGENSPRWGACLSKKIKEKMSRSRIDYLQKNPHKIIKGKDHSLYTNGHGRHFPYPVEFSEKLKEKIRERDKYQCQLCNANQNDTKFPVHHIDYEICNNKPRNLITLCNIHNPQANYNRKKWQLFFETYQELRGVDNV